MYTKFITLMVAVFLFCFGAACTRVQGGAVVGSGIGAGVGALIGHEAGDSGTGALIGAGVGAVAGALAADYHYTYMDPPYYRTSYAYTTPPPYRWDYAYSPTISFRRYSYADRYIRPRYYYDGGCYGCLGWPWRTGHRYARYRVVR